MCEQHSNLSSVKLQARKQSSNFYILFSVAPFCNAVLLWISGAHKSIYVSCSLLNSQVGGSMESCWSEFWFNWVCVYIWIYVIYEGRYI